MANGRINVGSCTSYGEVNYIWYIDWSSTSNVSNNTSSVKADFYVEKKSSKNNTVWDGSVNATCTVNGTVFSKNGFKWDMRGSAVGARVLICGGTVSVGHNADGTKSIGMSGYFPTDTSTAGTQNGGGTAYLDTIARASQPSLSASSIQIGNSVTIYSNRASSSFTHDAWFSFGNISWRHISSFGDSTSFTLPMDMLSQIGNTTSGTGTVIVRTYSNGVGIGDKTVGFTATVGGNIVPGIGDITLDTDTQVGSSWLFVQNKSKARVRSNAWGVHGSWITSCRVIMEGKEYWGTDIWTSIITGSGTRDVNVTVWDSRGRSATKTVQLTSISYSGPSITTATAFRCNSDGTANNSGNCVKVSYNSNVASINNANSKSFSVSLWSNGSKIKDLYYSDNSYSVNISNVYTDINTDKTYIVKFLTSDWYSSNSKEVALSTAFILMDFKGNGKGMAIGKASETDDLLDIGINTKFRNSIAFDGGITFPNDSSIMWNRNTDEAYISFKNTGDGDADSHMLFSTGDNGNEYFKFRCRSSSTYTDLLTIKTDHLRYKGNIVYHQGYRPSYSAGDVGAIPTSASCNKNWNWSGQGGQPPWLWGGNDGTNMYVYNPSNFNVNWASGSSYSHKWQSTGHGTSYLQTGNGDAASWSTHNVILRTWNGFGVRNNNDACTFLIDARSGNTFAKGYMMATKFTQSSDKRLKENITPIKDKFEKFFTDLNPVNYNLIELDDGRLHNGFIAQEVEQSMINNGISYDEFSGLEKAKYMPRNEGAILLSENDIEYSLSYGEFTALNTHMIQKCMKRIDQLENEVNTLKDKLNPVIL